jgi:hypothetical protein
MGRYPRRADRDLAAAPEAAIRRLAQETDGSGRGAQGRTAAYRRKLREARITPEGLVELVDASERFEVAPLTTKLADIEVADRHLRIFETSDPNLLLVKEKDLRGNHEYAIERDEGLVGDLKLYAQAP